MPVQEHWLFTVRGDSQFTMPQITWAVKTGMGQDHRQIPDWEGPSANQLAGSWKETFLTSYCNFQTEKSSFHREASRSWRLRAERVITQLQKYRRQEKDLKMEIKEIRMPNYFYLLFLWHVQINHFWKMAEITGIFSFVILISFAKIKFTTLLVW